MATFRFTDKEMTILAASIAEAIINSNMLTAPEKKDDAVVKEEVKASLSAEEDSLSDLDDLLDEGVDEEAPVPSIEEVRKALKQYASLEGKPAAIALLKEHGKTSSMGEMKERHFAAVIAACN